jgi:hypothetical protein
MIHVPLWIADEWALAEILRGKPGPVLASALRERLSHGETPSALGGPNQLSGSRC